MLPEVIPTPPITAYQSQRARAVLEAADKAVSTARCDRVSGTVVLLSDVPTVSRDIAFDTARPVFVSVLPEPALKPVDVTVAVCLCRLSP